MDSGFFQHGQHADDGQACVAILTHMPRAAHPPGSGAPARKTLLDNRTTIACFGEALIDFLARPGADGAPRQFVEHAGGAPANVAVAVARLGGDARFLGMLGQDMFGDFLLSQFQAHGVDVAHLRRTAEARTALAFVSLDAKGERSFEFYRPPAADLLFRATHFTSAALAGVGSFHVCSNSCTEPAGAATTLHGMRTAAAAGALVSIDLNLRPALWPANADPLPTLRDALALAHLVKLSREELDVIANGATDADALAGLFAGAARAVVVTDGAAPIRWSTRSARGEAATFRVDAVDTTAAGDAFVAGLLHALSERHINADTLEAAFHDDVVRTGLLRRAAAAGALATTRHGAFAAMSSMDEVNTLMERAP